MGFAKGRHLEYHVVQGLGKYAPQTEHDHRAELFVPEKSGHQFPAARNLRLNQPALEVVSGLICHSPGCLDYFPRVVKTEPDQPTLGLVGQFGAESFENDRKADLLCPGGCLVRINANCLVDDGNSVFTQKPLGVGLVQSAVS